MSRSPISRIVLVGFMAAGKTSVGRALAGRLGWRFADVDEKVEGDTGLGVPEIFERLGERRFRELEERAAAELLEEEAVVVATGGGWAARPGRLEGLGAGTVSIWLEVGPEEAVRRVATQPGGRPLLDVEDPVAAATALVEERSEHYRRATWRVDTEGRSVDDVTSRILEILSEHGMETHPE